MGARSILVRRSLRKTKGQFITIGLLIALASMLIHLAYILLADYPGNVKATTKRLNTEDVSLVLNSRESAEAAQAALADDKRVTEYEVDETLGFPASFEYNSEDGQSYAIVTEHGTSTDIGQVETVEELDTKVAHPIWLPLVFKTDGGHELGETFTLTIGGVEHQFTIQGFLLTPMRGNLELGVIELQTDRAGIDALAGNATTASAWNVKAKVSGDVDDVLLDLIQTAETAHTGGNTSIIHNVSIDVVSQQLTLMSRMISTMLAAFSLVFAGVVAMVIRHMVSSSIMREMPAIGSLQAGGFTSGQIVRVMTLPFAAVAAVFSLLGAALTSLPLPMVEGMFERQSGLTWNSHLSLPGAALAFVFLQVTVIATALISSSRVRKTPPVEALRGGEKAHSFRASRLPLASSRGPLPVLLGLKASLRSRTQNAAIFIIVAVATCACVLGVAIFSVFSNSRDFFATLTGDTSDVKVHLATGQSAYDMQKDLSTIPGVEKSVIYEASDATTQEGSPISLKIAEDFSLRGHDPFYEGRAPRHDNEIGIGGRLADSLGIGVGDDITIKFNGEEATYLVTGLSQTTMRFGMEALVTIDGAQRMAPGYEPPQLEVYLDKSLSPDQFIERVEADFAGRIVQLTNQEALLETNANSYLSMSRSLSFSILGLMAVIILLIIWLVVSSAMTKERRDYGILKSLGYTHRQLAAYTVAAHVPPVAIGTVVGLIAGCLTAVPILGQLLRGIGIMQLDSELPPLMVAAVGVAILVLSTALMLLLARRTRNITSRDLLTE